MASTARTILSLKAVVGSHAVKKNKRSHAFEVREVSIGFADLLAGQRLAGVIVDGDVVVVAIDIHGPGSATLTYRSSDGQLGDRILTSDDSQDRFPALDRKSINLLTATSLSRPVMLCGRASGPACQPIDSNSTLGPVQAGDLRAP